MGFDRYSAGKKFLNPPQQNTRRGLRLVIGMLLAAMAGLGLALWF